MSTDLPTGTPTDQPTGTPTDPPTGTPTDPPTGSPTAPGEAAGDEDAKLVTLARSARARTRAFEGACVRDTDGRTYAAATVDLPTLRLSAVQVAVAMAVSSGSAGLEAVVVLTESAAVNEGDVSAVRDFAGAGVPVRLAAPDGTVVGEVSS